MQLADFELRAYQCNKVREDQDQDSVSGSWNLARALCRIDPRSEPFVSRAEEDLVDQSALQEKSQIQINPIAHTVAHTDSMVANESTDFQSSEWIELGRQAEAMVRADREETMDTGNASSSLPVNSTPSLFFLFSTL